MYDVYSILSEGEGVKLIFPSLHLLVWQSTNTTMTNEWNRRLQNIV